MPLTLTDHEVRQVLTMTDAIVALEEALKAQARGKVVLGERVNMMLPNGWIRLAPAALLQEDVLGYKEFHLSLPVGVRYTIHLFEASTGRPLALMDAQHITDMRTGATSAIATKYLATPSATTVGVIGSGAEARTQLEALACVRQISQVKVFSPNAERRARFAEEMSTRLELVIVPVSSREEAIEGSDLLIAATFTRDQGPVLFERHLRPGLHISSIGSTLPNQRELDSTVWPLVDRIVVDTSLVLKESGDVLAASKAGTLDALKILALEDIIAGKAPGRTSNDEVTLFKSVGTAVQDIVIGYAVYKEAIRGGLGHEIADVSSIKSAR
jgi:alanine dehydrogenase